MIERTRPIAAPKSTVTSPVCTPYIAARRAVCATVALARSALVGLQPWFRQVPPARSISMIATLLALAGQGAGHAGSSLAGADHDRVVGGHLR